MLIDQMVYSTTIPLKIISEIRPGRAFINVPVAREFVLQGFLGCQAAQQRRVAAKLLCPPFVDARL